jgi:hypothetical protein
MNIAKIISRAKKSVIKLFIDNEIGSGVIIDREGLILTNHHVISRNYAAGVILSDGRVGVGKVLWSNPYRDIAFLITDLRCLSPAQVSYSPRIEVGEEIITIGHPQDLPYSVTKGIISYPSRIMPETPNLPFIQFDAPISAGNSGGALINLAGRFIGVICGSRPYAQNLNLAIPIYEIKQSLLDIIRRIGWYKSSLYCQVCGEANSKHAVFCKKCGARLKTRGEINEIVEITKKNIKDYIVCRNCIHLININDNSSNFCDFCGKNFLPEANISKTPRKGFISCPVCKQKNKQGLPYCLNCGFNLERDRRHNHA